MENKRYLEFIVFGLFITSSALGAYYAGYTIANNRCEYECNSYVFKEFINESLQWGKVENNGLSWKPMLNNIVEFKNDTLLQDALKRTRNRTNVSLEYEINMQRAGS
jgi:hypothetical protein